MRVAVRDKLTAGLGMNTNISSDLFYVDAEARYWLNNAQRDVAQQIRKARSNFFTKIINTTDSSILIGQTQFNPASMQITSGVGNYTLPPDFIAARLMTDLSSGTISPGTRFTFVNNLANEMFRGIMFVNANSTQKEYLCCVIDKLTLLLRPIPQETRDFQLVYEYALPSLTEYNSKGTATVTNGSTIVAVSNDSNLVNNVAVGDEFIFGTGASAYATADPSIDYPIVTVVQAGQLTLASNWIGATQAGYTFTTSKVSPVPVMHHDLLIYHAVRQGAMKSPNPAVDLANLMAEEFNRELRALLDDIEMRQFSDGETSEAYMEDSWDYGGYQ